MNAITIVILVFSVLGAVDYVLGNFSKEDLKILNVVAKKTVEIIDNFIKNGVDYCMNEYNSFIAE